MREALSGGYTGENSASVNQSKLSLALVSNQESSPCLSVSPIPLKWIVFHLRELNMVQTIFAYLSLPKQTWRKAVVVQSVEWS